MEKELHITASVPLQIQSCKETFYANRGYGTVELTPYGDYLLNTVGITDATARRTNEYKSAYKKVSANMLHAYEYAFCRVCRKTQKRIDDSISSKIQKRSFRF